jgi:hypothetical protein
MVEKQAADRVHRIGQTRTVSVVRYITNSSVETVGFMSLLTSPLDWEEPLADLQRQYVQWIQRHKIALSQDALESQSFSQAEVDDERWKVRLVPFPTSSPAPIKFSLAYELNAEIFGNK